MIDKFHTWSVRVVAALALAAIAHQGVAFAQETSANTEPGRLVVPLSGSASVNRNGSLSASPSRVDTGLVDIGGAKSVAITLSHTGAGGPEPVTIGQATMIGQSASEYTSNFGGFRTLSPGESVTVQIEFRPQTPGTKSAALRLDIDGATAPYVVLLDGGARYPLTSTLALGGGTVKFGQVNTDEVATKSFTLKNQGDPQAPAINVSAIVIGGDTPGAFTLDFQPTTLAPGETLTVGGTMGPGIAGTKKAALEVFHDGNNPNVEVVLEGELVEPKAVPVNFSVSTLQANQQINSGTSIQFGPDGKLYVAEKSGLIHVFDVIRKGKNDYSANKIQTVDQITKVPNHDDDGSEADLGNKRLLTGIHVVGSAAQPIIYAASSDPREAPDPPRTTRTARTSASTRTPASCTS